MCLEAGDVPVPNATTTYGVATTVRGEGQVIVLLLISGRGAFVLYLILALSMREGGPQVRQAAEAPR